MNKTGIDSDNADKSVKICPKCYQGWEFIDSNHKHRKPITYFYGNWKNVARGKEKKICLKCE